jgi:hypothetical protein
MSEELLNGIYDELVEINSNIALLTDDLLPMVICGVVIVIVVLIMKWLVKL